MPYCPKCDMEFVEGITVCSDCGGPLVESEEAAKELKRKEEEARLNAAREACQTGREDGEDSAFPYDEEDPEKALKKEVRPAAPYIKKSQKYEDLKSSAAAFLAVGGIFLIFSILCWSNVIALPMQPASKFLIQGVVTAMGVGCLLIWFFTLRSAKNMAPQIEAEEAKTSRIISWFLSSYTAKGLDAQLSEEFPGLSREELDLKRFALIQDYLVTNNDLPDQAYVDSLCEEIYTKLYGQD